MQSAAAINKNRGFTLVEVLIAMVLMSMLMTAVAIAFDASMKNYQANRGIYQTVNTARQILLRITTDLRSADAVNVTGAVANKDQTQYGQIADQHTLSFDGDDASNLSLFASDGNAWTYRYDSGDKVLYLDNNLTAASYVLCRNVQNLTFTRTTLSGAPTRVRTVRVSITLSDDAGQVTHTASAAAVVRKNIY